MGLAWCLQRVKAEGKLTGDGALRALGGGMHGAIWEKNGMKTTMVLNSAN
jgi:hypothetical protein